MNMSTHIKYNSSYMEHCAVQHCNLCCGAGVNGIGCVFQILPAQASSEGQGQGKKTQRRRKRVSWSRSFSLSLSLSVQNARRGLVQHLSEHGRE